MKKQKKGRCNIASPSKRVNIKVSGVSKERTYRVGTTYANSGKEKTADGILYRISECVRVGKSNWA